MKINYYGRRILKFSIPGGYIFTKSGQWIGHKYYGNDRGTERQIKNAFPHKFENNGGCVISFEGSSDKIFWNLLGYAGDIIAKMEGDEWTGNEELVKKLSFS